MTRVLVTGAGGPIGRAIGRASAETIRTAPSGRGALRALDVTDEASVRDVLGDVRPDTVVHLARPSADAPAAPSAGRVARWCAELGVRRFLLASSAAVYGTRTPAPRREDEPAAPESEYGALKVAAEVAVAEVAAETGLEACALRIFNVYGPGLAQSLVNRLVARSPERPVVQLTDAFVRDYVHVDDVAGAILAVAAHDRPLPPALNVGTGVATSNLDLLALIPDAGYDRDPSPTAGSYSVADPALMERTVGYAPAIGLADAVLDPSRRFG